MWPKKLEHQRKKILKIYLISVVLYVAGVKFGYGIKLNHEYDCERSEYLLRIV